MVITRIAFAENESEDVDVYAVCSLLAEDHDEDVASFLIALSRCTAGAIRPMWASERVLAASVCAESLGMRSLLRGEPAFTNRELGLYP